MQNWFRMNLSQAAEFVQIAYGWEFLSGLIVWNLWLYRNSMILDVDNVLQELLLDKSRREVDEAMCAYQSSRLVCETLHVPSLAQQRWQAPPMGWVKLNSDRAGCLSNGRASCGSVIHSHSGGMLLVGFNKFIGICSVLESKLLKVFEGLKATWNIGVRRVIVELDNLDAVRLLQVKF
ncbi:hypothetical protein V6N12_017980 [Hibiscus sabdariffa]|uniref:RNase H type-1 domain-containing protein n=1 Tax=Hibiscus sabdariffa TaxID=183260 RepID=A0ABR1ZSV5_9ROSI